MASPSGPIRRFGNSVVPILLFLLIASVIVFADGCASFPQVRYSRAAADARVDEEGVVPFALQAALVTVAPRSSKGQGAGGTKAGFSGGAGQSGADLTLAERVPVEDITALKQSQAFATQSEAAGPLYALEPEASMLRRTSLSIAYYDGHHSVKSIGTTFEDRRVKMLQAVGGTAAALVPVVIGFSERAEAEKLQLPLVFDFRDPGKFGTRDAFTAWEPIAGFKTWWYRYRVSQPRGRTVNAEEFFAARAGKFTRQFPVSACADLTLEIGNGPGGSEAGANKVSYQLTVPDPSFVEPLPLPAKGSITAHVTCGADITSDSVQSTDMFSMLEAAGKQVEAIWKAQEQAKEKAAEKGKK